MMRKRTVDFQTLLNELKQNSTETQTVLNILSQIEIGALDVESVNATKIQQFLHLLPQEGYHFSFIRQNAVYYMLSHTTLRTARDPLGAAEDLHKELQKHARRDNVTSPCEILNNQATLSTLKTFLEKVQELQTSFNTNQFLAATLPDRKNKKAQRDISDNGTQYLVRNVFTQIETITEQTRPYSNCRLIAELLDILYHNTLQWASALMQYHAFANPAADHELDIMLKMHYFYKYYKSVNSDLNSEFQTFVTSEKRNLSAFMVSDADGDQQVGAEHIKDFSFKMFNANLNDRDTTGLAFPILLTSFSVLNHMGVENIFFHQGLIFRLLSDDSPLSASEMARLDLISQMCTHMANDFFRTATKKSMKLRDLMTRIRTFTALGLNRETSRIYAQMALLQPSRTTPKKGGEMWFEVRQQLIIMIYNTYVFFMCLWVYSPTFLFLHRRRMILEQQKSTLIGSRHELQFIWDNVTRNINQDFNVLFTEEEFNVCTKGTTESEKEYLYRDLINKWGDILFVLKPKLNPDAQSPPLDDVTTADVIKRCAMINLSETSVPYESLLPLIHHPSFLDTFMNLVIVPEFSQILTIPYKQFMTIGSPRLLRLIHACRLLVPDQMTLYNKLVSLYNLITFVSEIDAGVFRTVYSLTLEISAILESLCGEPVSPELDLLVELMAQSLSHNLENTVNPLIEEVMQNNSASITRYLEHTHLCYCFAHTTGQLSADMMNVELSLGSKLIARIPMVQFLELTKTLIAKDQKLTDNLQRIEERLQQINQRMKQVKKDFSQLHDYSKNHPLAVEIVKSLKKTSRVLKNLEQRLLTILDQAKKSNKLIIHSLKRIEKTCMALSNRNLEEHGIRYCIAEARGVVRTHQGVAAIPPSALDQVPSNAESKLRGFLRAFREATVEHSPLQMSARTDSQQQIPIPDVLTNRYQPSNQTNDLLKWYITSKDQAQTDILTSIHPEARHA
ncbi:tegument protein UL37 [Mandrillus leucophaeus cytomegalovirus]|uniref:Tegument protein UL37 n=1 Tax=Mandrillus leucophaeus cytomegalovirus TaxID=1654930 RepID=A0A0G2UI56_9BETA|nr:tegument protein UL37 [Mandrillus leucophaeus cytomegalovirus]AKI29784.1 tegument protein UL37 [Mandrillus leucophaeus cytomegalovirus]